VIRAETTKKGLWDFKKIKILAPFRSTCTKKVSSVRTLQERPPSETLATRRSQLGKNSTGI
jgi:hypothetical protein